MRVIFGIIKLYFSLGVLFGLVLFTSKIYQAYVAPPPGPDVVAAIGDALVQAFFRVFLWAPTLYQFVLVGDQPFLQWLLN